MLTGARGTRTRALLALAVGAAAMALVALLLVRSSRPAVSGAPAATLSVAPATAGAGSVAFLGAGDIATCSGAGDEATAAILDVVPGTIFTLGDNAYEDGTKAEFDRCYAPTWGRQLDRTKPSPGNHEYDTRDAAGYFEYFGARAGEGDRGYYAYELGAWRIYSLNSNCEDIAGGCGEGSAELEWLRHDVRAHPSRCALAYWHHPRFSSGEHGDNAAMGPIWDALAEADTEVVLAGHDHDYERFSPMAAGGTPDERGIASFVVGTGGKDLRDFETVDPNSLVRNSDTWGVLELVLSVDRWSALFIPVAGSTFSDRATGRCH